MPSIIYHLLVSSRKWEPVEAGVPIGPFFIVDLVTCMTVSSMQTQKSINSGWAEAVRVNKPLGLWHDDQVCYPLQTGCHSCCIKPVLNATTNPIGLNWSSQNFTWSAAQALHTLYTMSSIPVASDVDGDKDAASHPILIFLLYESADSFLLLHYDSDHPHPSCHTHSRSTLYICNVF